MKGRKIASCMQLFTRHLSHFNVSIKAQIALQQQQWGERSPRHGRRSVGWWGGAVGWTTANLGKWGCNEAKRTGWKPS